MIAKTTLLLACAIALGCSIGTEEPAAPSYAWTGLKISHAGLFTNDCARYTGDFHGGALCSLGISVDMRKLQGDISTLPDDQDRADLETAVGAWLDQWAAFDRHMCFSHETAVECANESYRLSLKQTAVTNQIARRVTVEQKAK